MLCPHLYALSRHANVMSGNQSNTSSSTAREAVCPLGWSDDTRTTVLKGCISYTVHLRHLHPQPATSHQRSLMPRAV